MGVSFKAKQRRIFRAQTKKCDFLEKLNKYTSFWGKNLVYKARCPLMNASNWNSTSVRRLWSECFTLSRRVAHIYSDLRQRGLLKQLSTGEFHLFNNTLIRPSSNQYLLRITWEFSKFWIIFSLLIVTKQIVVLSPNTLNTRPDLKQWRLLVK